MSMGGIVGLFINIIMASVVWSVMGFADYMLIQYANKSPLLQQDGFNTINNLMIVYIAGIFLILLVLGVNYIITSNSESNAEV